MTMSKAAYYIFLFTTPFSISFSLFIIWTYFKYKECKIQPGDLMLGISISDFVLSIHWLVSALFSKYGPFKHTIHDIRGSLFCKINAIFSTAAGVNSFLYNTSFCICIIMMIRKPLDKTEKKYKKYFHYGNITIVVIFVLIY
jgi:1-phosphatidylinositol-4-phosphate 5-kinase